jgi:arylsulfatase A-like enzyme
MTIDLLPTIARLTDTNLPDHKIDGKDIFDLMRCKPGATSPQEAYYFYWNNDLEAIRSGKWKLHFPHQYRTLDGRSGGTGGIPTKYSQAETRLALYDLENDISEEHNVAKDHPDVVTYLTRLADTITDDIGNGTKQGPGYRAPGKI